MKVNELMLGDWLYQTSLVLDYDQTDWIRERAFTQVNADLLYAFDTIKDELEPIPLTSKILEKNGFEYDDNENCWKLIKKDDRYTLYSIYVNTNRISIYNWINKEGERFTDACNKVNVHYKYVHQLQHALRLCGLNELADDNFKVW